MIILSGVLVIVAIALLVAGIVAGNGDSAQVLGLDALVVIYISIGVSVVSALCLAVGVFLRRNELWGTGAATASRNKTGTKSKSGRKGKGRKKAPAPVPATGRAKPAVPAARAEDAGDEAEIPPPPADVPGEAMVFVVRGRKRYHLDTCRQLAGRDREELTYAEAKEEGFSSCTACMPDTALAARAAVSVPAGPAQRVGSPGESGPGESGPGPAAPEAAVTTELPAPGDPAQTSPSVPSPGRPEEHAPGSAPTDPAPTDPAPTDPSAASVPAEPEPVAPAPESDVEAAAEPPGPVPSAWPAPGTPAPTATDVAAASDSGDAPPPDTEPAEPAGPTASVPPPAAPDAALDEDAPVLILSGTKRYHRAGCSLIEDIGEDTEDLETITRGEATARGCTPCLVCRPDST